jgi:hypothetical protein
MRVEAIVRKPTMLIIGLVTALSLASCASNRPNTEQAVSVAAAAGTETPTAEPSTLPPAQFAGNITAPTTNHDTGFTLDPPGDSSPTVSWQSAYATCLTGNSICDPSLAPTISLAKVTDPNSGTANAGGSISPILDHSLVYVITYTGVPCKPAGGIPGSDPSAPDSYSCTVENFVSAADGSVIYSVQAARH